MIWQSAIYSNLVLVTMAMLIPQRSLGGTVEGQVRLVASRDAAAPKKTNDSGVVVWLSTPEEIAPRGRAKHAQMLQKDKKFSPHILAIETRTIVDFPNLDPIFHNAFSNFDGTIFDVALYPPGSSRQVRFDRPGIVRVFCNIHPSMSAIIVVVNSKHFTITDRAGRYSLTDVRPGQYEIHFFHERVLPDVLENLTRTIAAPAETETLPPVAISEAGYLPVAHKNKYGKDYPPNSDERNDYSLPVQ